MKYLHTFSLALTALALLVFTGCSDELQKSDYTYFTGNASALPSLRLAVVPSGNTVDFTGTVTFSDHQDTVILDQGVICSSDTLFQNLIAIESVQNSLSGVVRGLSDNTDYFAKAYVMTKNGIAYSPVVKFKTRQMQMLVDYTMEDLVNSFSGFGSVDKDGDGNDWLWTYYDKAKTELVGMSFSWDDNESKPLTPENYLLFPVVDVPSQIYRASVSVDLEPADANYPSDVFKLVVSENPITSDNCQTATELLVDSVGPVGKEYSADLPNSYIGKKAYIALCHYKCTNKYAIVYKGHKVKITL